MKFYLDIPFAAAKKSYAGRPIATEEPGMMRRSERRATRVLPQFGENPKS
jgi:hypothetical protein